ncbi:periplasmic chaperone for outer membrane proteins Skp [Chitinophaga costaii]|uniref:Periplasmic chaperone for outer membrane proteins Skp n=1 Tax=Chitinophaga costaii TaxID=1335309 RepID=A0A1C4F5Y9_9BACT|nr:OmpH family outer membrane protein [Chitinophaga costaii]SCC51254.1 periplasmic chaperone for outer membrane proteins Skp [Chitinophaga costaii]
MKKYVSVAVVALSGLFSATAMAQSKIGYINAQAVVEAMPDTKTAQASLQSYAEDLDKGGKSLVDEYQSQAKAFQDSSAKWSANMQQAKAEQVQQIQKRIEDYRQSAEQKIDAKKSEVLKPIYDKARKAIEDVAKEKGYGYVIDSSSGILLSMPPGDDLMAAVKTKLGIK